MATPPGVGAVAIIRISGPDAVAVADRCFKPAGEGAWRAAGMRRGRVFDPHNREPVDDALAVAFFAPHSYTGEDVVELHAHGGAGVIAAVMRCVLSSGARLAAAGEFTRRAFVNGRVDLAQAEAVADLIAAESTLAAKAALCRLEGSTGRELGALRQALLDRLVEIEAHVDYPDEVPPPSDAALSELVDAQRRRLCELIDGANTGQMLRDGLECVICGPPNAGKSSLLNALLEADRAIVSDIPGTTRDIVEDRVAVDGILVRLRDTAGLRATSDPIEAEGVARARAAIEHAQLVIVVIDGSRPLGADEEAALTATQGRVRIVLANKADLGDAGARALRDRPEMTGAATAAEFVCGSVRDGDSIDAVRSAIARLGWGGAAIDANAAVVANVRQIEALTRAKDALDHAASALDAALPIDLVTNDLRAAVGAYGEITGESVTEAVLDGIFSRFCVGK